MLKTRRLPSWLQRKLHEFSVLFVVCVEHPVCTLSLVCGIHFIFVSAYYDELVTIVTDSMCHFMSFFVTSLAKTLVTISTLVWFISCVCHFMLFLATCPAEALVTILALVWFISRVCHFILFLATSMPEVRSIYRSQWQYSLHWQTEVRGTIDEELTSVFWVVLVGLLVVSASLK